MEIIGAPQLLDDTSIAVRVTNAWKTYDREIQSDKHYVLRNLCMNVPTSSIYALLGATGCGKTTLLSSIANLTQLDAGDIRVWGEVPGTASCGIPGSKIGFMPQETALYRTFTIHEMLYLFGRIHRLDSALIKKRTDFLVSLLNLPRSTRFISTYSLGQQRRISFAVALLHDPDLLVLDEPTVGVDPILRQCIWSHLVALAAQGKTIIISTHYIEEARSAHKVALMRGGRLVIEETPDVLLKSRNTNSMEQAFLSICKEHKETAQNDISPQLLQNKKLVRGYKRSEQTRSSVILSFLSLVSVLVWKEYMRLTRSILFLTIYFVLPAFVTAVTSFAISLQPHGINVGIVNDDANVDQCSIQTPVGCDFHHLSCEIIHTVNEDQLTLNYFTYAEEGIAAIHEGKVKATIIIPRNFSAAMEERAFKGRFSDHAVLDSGQPHVHAIGDDKLIAYFLFWSFYKTVRSFVDEKATACNMRPAVMKDPVMYDEPVFGHMEITPLDTVLPGIIIGILFTVSMDYSDQSYSEEKRLKMMDRLTISGVSRSSLMTAYVVLQFVVATIQIIVTSCIGVYAFGMSFNVGPLLPTILLLLQTIVGIHIGFLISQMVSDEVLSIQVEVFIFVVSTLSAGIIWPVYFLHPAVQFIVKLFPLTRAVHSLRSLMLLGREFTHESVWTGFVSSISWIFILMLLNFAISKVKKH